MSEAERVIRRRAAVKRYKQRHPEKVAKRLKRWRTKNADRVRAGKRASYHRNRDKTVQLLRKKHLQEKYGLTVAQYEAMHRRQGGKCKVCREPEKTNARLAVDHCHTTGRVRGLLCKSCNWGIGLLKDDAKLLRRAAGYLE